MPQQYIGRNSTIDVLREFGHAAFSLVHGQGGWLRLMLNTVLLAQPWLHEQPCMQG
jgi:hypothetical protein